MRSAEALDAYAGPGEHFVHAPGDRDGVGSVAVDAQRVRLDGDRTAARGLDLSVDDEMQHAGGDEIGVVQHGSGLAAGKQGAVRAIGAVGEGLRDRADPAFGCEPEEDGAGQADDRQLRVEHRHRVQHRARLVLVVGHRRIESTVRFQIAHRGPGDPAHAVERPELIEHVGGELRRGDVEEPATEPRAIGIAHVGPDRHAPLGGGGDGAPHDDRVTRVEPARDVGARHDIEHRVVIAHPPGAEGLPEVRVEIDVHGSSLP